MSMIQTAVHLGSGYPSETMPPMVVRDQVTMAGGSVALHLLDDATVYLHTPQAAQALLTAAQTAVALWDRADRPEPTDGPAPDAAEATAEFLGEPPC